MTTKIELLIENKILKNKLNLGDHIAVMLFANSFLACIHIYFTETGWYPFFATVMAYCNWECWKFYESYRYRTKK
jgi:hypothetical protein